MICTNCGHDVTGKKFCPECGSQTGSQAGRPCPACGMSVAPSASFCTNCGHNIAATAQSYTPPPQTYSNPYQQQPHYPQQGYNNTQYPQQPYSSPQYPQQQYQQPYNQPQYPQQQYQQPYGQPGYNGQMVLRCPTCMAMAPVGSPACRSCNTSLSGVVPMPPNMQPQQGGFMQSGNGKLAMGALGGAAAVIGGEMLLHGLENRFDDGVAGNLGFGEHHHHRRDEEDGGLLGDLGNLGNDIGLF